MADRFPLILNTSANQIQEIGSGDQLDLSGNNIANAGIITAGNVTIGAATTDLVVTGDARITGILTIGTSSLKLDGPNNLVNVGTALTLGHTQGLQFHTQNLHSAGFEVNQINASGIITATQADINGDLDVDGHTNLDNVSVAGVSTFANDVIFDNANKILYDTSNSFFRFGDNVKAGFGNNGDLEIYHTGSGSVINDAGTGSLHLRVGGSNRINVEPNGVGLFYGGNRKLETTSTGVSLSQDLDVDGHTNLDNVSIAGVVTASHLDYMTSKNIRIGENAGDSFSGTDANENILIGYNAGTSIDVCDKNVAIGVSALESVTGVKQGCVAIGYEAAKSYNNDGLTTGPVAIGFQALRAGGKGVQVAVGYRALTDCNSTGYWNVATGSDCLRQVTSGKMNVAHGTSCLSDITTAEKNTALGHQAGKTLYSGNNNIMIGYHAYASGSHVSNEITLGNSLNTKLRVPGLGLIFSTSGNTIAGDTTFSSGITGTTATFSGNVSIGGTLTYEDVSNIDSVGIVTARSGLVSPNADIDDFISVGSNIHLGNAGVVTATSFVGSGAALTGIDATSIKDSGGNVKIQAQASGAVHSGISTFNEINLGDSTGSGNNRLKFGVGNEFQIYHNSVHTMIENSTGALWIKSTHAGHIYLYTGGSHGIYLEGDDGHVYPSSDSAIDIGSNAVRFRNVYADTLYGDGSNLTGITQTTINSNTNNYLVTGTGTANTLQGEQNLTFNGTDLAISEGGTLKIGTSANLEITSVSGNKARIQSQQEDLYIETSAAKSIILKTNRTGTYAGWTIETDGDFVPSGNKTCDIGSSSKYVDQSYLADINCENIVITQNIIRTSTGGNIGSSSYKFDNVYATNFHGSGANLTGLSVDVVNDTSPQLGGSLDVNNKNVNFGDSSGSGVNRLRLGANNELQIFHGANGINYISGEVD